MPKFSIENAKGMILVAFVTAIIVFGYKFISEYGTPASQQEAQFQQWRTD